MVFCPVDQSPDRVLEFFSQRHEAVIFVSRHGLGDNIFFSPCFEKLRSNFEKIYFCSSVNAYATIFHESGHIRPLYVGGINGGGLGLSSTERFIEHFKAQKLELPHQINHVYHFGLFEIPLAMSHPQAFVKGRRNLIELFGESPSPRVVPRYHVAPDLRSKSYVEAIINDWLPGRDLICIARYGHTDAKKNFGHTHEDGLETVNLIERRFPGRFKFLSLDYLPNRAALDGRLPILRSVYGFLPCDPAALHHVLARAILLITVPTGPMLLGATISGLKLLTLWKDTYLKPFHYLDPQFDVPAYALVETKRQASTDFMQQWEPEDRAAVEARWRVNVCPLIPKNVAAKAIELLL